MEINDEIQAFLTPQKTALLVWDVQKMLVANIFNPDEFMANNNKVIAAARAKVFRFSFQK